MGLSFAKGAVFNMAHMNTESYRLFEDFVAQTGGTYVFDGETSVKGIGMLLDVMKDMGLNPAVTGDLKKGFMSVFNIEVVNMPDLDHNRFIFAPNHVSDADALILGLLHPRIRIVSKDGWTNNAKLRQLLDAHYDLRGLERTSLQSLRRLLADSIDYFNGSDENKHFLVFSQGTISDFNHNSPERVSTIAQKISDRTGVPIVPIFVEQVSLHHPTRIVFDTPMILSKKDDFRALWLEREKAMQNALTPPARMPRLSHKHANNNKPGDPFF
jgi:hypothetical protein